MSNPPTPSSFKEQMLLARQEAIIGTANRLLAQKGFDAMTVDEVAAAVGIAKANVFQLFPSKEDLATAAMVRVMRRALEFVQQLPADDAPIARLRSVAAWAMDLQLAGEMPLVPGLKSTLRKSLAASSDYSSALNGVSEVLLDWIGQAQADGSMNRALPPSVVLWLLYARACDPAVEYLKAKGEYTDPEIVELLLGACFDGLRAR